MAQNITLLGASYSAVPAVTLPKTGGGTASFTDVTDTTATASDVASGKYFYTAAGTRTAGTGSGGSTLQSKTYNVSGAGTSTVTADDGYDGLSSVSVNVPQASASYIGNSSSFITEAGVRKWQTRARVEVETFDGGVEGWLAEGTVYGNTIKYNAVEKNTVITPTTSSQTIGGANYMMEGAVTVNPIPSQYKDTSSGDITASDVVSGKIGFNASGSVTGTLVVQTYYTGSSNPSSSLGINGDIYLKVV